MNFYGYNPPPTKARQPNPFYRAPSPPADPTRQHTRSQSSWQINQLTQDHYGTDVPTLWNEIDQLQRKLKHRKADLKECERELKDLRQKHGKAKERLEAVTGLYERAVELLRGERERRWGRVRRLY